MRAPGHERFARRWEHDRHGLARLQVDWRCRPQLRAVAQVDLDTHLGQHRVRRVGHGAGEGLAHGVVRQHQVRACPHRIVGVSELVLSCGLFAAALSAFWSVLASSFGAPAALLRGAHAGPQGQPERQH